MLTNTPDATYATLSEINTKGSTHLLKVHTTPDVQLNVEHVIELQSVRRVLNSHDLEVTKDNIVSYSIRECFCLERKQLSNYEYCIYLKVESAERTNVIQMILNPETNNDNGYKLNSYVVPDYLVLCNNFKIAA